MPLAFAAWSVWQPPQPALAKTALPASAFPGGSFGPAVVVVVSSVPMTVSGVGVTVVPPQPASSSAAGTAMRASRRIGPQLY